MRLRTIHFVVAVLLVPTVLAASGQKPAEVIVPADDTTTCSAEIERLRKLVDEQKKMISLLEQKIKLLEEEKARTKKINK